MVSREVNNTTSVGEQMPREERALEVLPQLLPIGFVVTLTNIVVFVLFCSRQSLRKASNFLLFSLAFCDFLNGSLNISLFIVLFARVVKGAKFQALLCAVEVSHNFIAITGGCHIFLITAEKYMAVMRPLKYHVIKKKTMLLLIGGAWLTSAVVASAPISWFSMRYRKTPIGFVLETAFNAFCLFALFVLPYTFIIYAHVAMFRKVCKRNRHRQGFVNRASSKTSKKKKNERKCLIIFAVMATVFAVCWLPWFVLRLIYSLIGLRLITPDYVAMEIAAHGILIVRYLTSAINPLLYTFFKQDFWRALKRTLIQMSRKDLRLSSSGMSKPKKRSTLKAIHINQSNSLETPRVQSRKHLDNRVQVV